MYLAELINHVAGIVTEEELSLFGSVILYAFSQPFILGTAFVCHISELSSNLRLIYCSCLQGHQLCSLWTSGHISFDILYRKFFTIIRLAKP